MDQLDIAKLNEMESRDRNLANQLAKAQETEQPRELSGVRYCLGCGDPIEPERLGAYPTAVRCVDCKQLMERREAQYAR